MADQLEVIFNLFLIGFTLVSEVMDLKIDNGDTVHLEYTGRFESGDIFDTSDIETAKTAGIYNDQRSYEPLVVKVGTGQIIRGLDRALLGMEKGEKKEVTVNPEEGYGEKRPELIQQVLMNVFRQSGIDPKEGMMIGTQNGAAIVTGVSEDAVELDFNHPLAGKTLVFEVQVLEIEKE
jgi:peptidylprolyl isomerase